MTPTEFVALYPRLFHMAEADAWPLIQQHGLLGTRALLDLFEVQGEKRETIERQQRADFVTIEHPVHGQALIRDQRPLSDATLAPVLLDNLSPSDWYALLNARVFFWVEEARLDKLLSAYRHRNNIVLVLSSERVLADYADRIALSPINSGFSLRYAQQRGLDTFKRLGDFETWKVASNGQRTRATVAECTINDRLTKIEKYLEEKRVVNARTSP